MHLSWMKLGGRKANGNGEDTQGKVVRVVPNGETSFDRIVATCYIDGDKTLVPNLLAVA